MDGTRPALERPRPAVPTTVLSWRRFLAALRCEDLERVRSIPGRVPGDWRTEPRIAPSWTVHYLFCAPQAALEVVLLEGRHRVEPGTLLWFPPGVPYELVLDSSRASEVLHRLRFALRRGGRLLSPLRDALELPRATFVGELVHRAAQEQARPGILAEYRLRCVLGLLAAEVAERREQAPGSTGLSPAQLGALRAHLAAHPDARPGPAELAAELGYAPGYFTRLFRAAVGMPPRRWLVVERIRLASQRLLETAVPVAELALEFGYDNPFLFSRQFAAVMGCSPSAWRARHR